MTDVSAFAQCPRKYYLSRYLRIQMAGAFAPAEDEPVPDAGELDGTELGIQVHALLANKLVELPHPLAEELAAVFRTSQLGRRSERAERKEHEHDFLMSVDDVVLRGQIDLWFEHNRKLILVDYKTDQVTAPIDADRIRAYELQLQIYALAMQKIVGRAPDQAFLHFLRPDVLVEVDIRPLAIHTAREAVLELRAAQESLAFPLRTGPHCYRCEHFRKLCPAGRDVMLATNAN